MNKRPRQSAEIRTVGKTQGEKYYCNIMAHLGKTLDCLLAQSLSTTLQSSSGVVTPFRELTTTKKEREKNKTQSWDFANAFLRLAAGW